MTTLKAKGHSGHHDSGQAVNFTVNNVPRSLRRAPNGFKCKAASEVAVKLHLFATHPEYEWAKSIFLMQRGGVMAIFYGYFLLKACTRHMPVDTMLIRLKDAKGFQ